MKSALSAIVLAVAALLGGCATSQSIGNETKRDLLAGWSVVQPRCEYRTDPVGIDVSHPRFSWELAAGWRDMVQSAYEIQVASSREALDSGRCDVWSSGKVQSQETNQIAYAGPALQSRQRYFWRVQAWTRSGKVSGWSPTSSWEMGLLEPSDWNAKFITTDPGAIQPMQILGADFHTLDGAVHKDVAETLRGKIKDGRLQIDVKPDALGGDPAQNQLKELTIRYTVDGRPIEVTSPENRTLRLPPGPVRVLSKSFKAKAPIQQARLYVTALGLYAAELNGKHVGRGYLNPGWTDYRQRVQYQTIDVTDRVHAGANQLDISLADGWYAGYIGNGRWHQYGDAPALMAQLEVRYADGSSETIATDESWTSRRGLIVAADNMYGEWCDGTTAKNASADRVVVVNSGVPPKIVAQSTAPVGLDRVLKAERVVEAPRGSGRWVYDLGQNMVGTAALHIAAPPGTRLTMRYGEALNPDGSLYVANLRGAVTTDTYICKGDPKGESWSAAFAYHGFRYVELSGVTQPPLIDAVLGLVYCSYYPPENRAGSFVSSSDALNQLQSNIEWGQRGNFVSVPTDCPQRDERQGWMGDAEVFVQTALYNADLASFYSNWLVDVDSGRSPAGAYSDVSPDVLQSKNHGSPAWADAGVIVPYTVYQMYGDRRELEQHYPAMKRFVDWCHEQSTDLIRDKDRGADFGDWLADHADTPKELIGTAFFAHAADLVARSAKALDRPDDAKAYDELFHQIAAAFCKRYLDDADKLRADTQTAEALAIEFDLLQSDAQRKAVGDQLVANLRARGTRLSTGFVGVSHLLPALTKTGHSDVAYEVLLQDAYPSWLFSVKQGATTIWERWDGWTPEKGFQDISMNSLNHYSLGSCGQWFYQAIAGINQSGVGFRQIVINPVLPPDGPDGKPLLTHAKASYASINGPITSEWVLDAHRQLTLKVSIPANCTATVHVPTSDRSKVTADEAQLARAENGAGSDAEAVYAVPSGEYVFHAPTR